MVWADAPITPAATPNTVSGDVKKDAAIRIRDRIKDFGKVVRVCHAVAVELVRMGIVDAAVEPVARANCE